MKLHPVIACLTLASASSAVAIPPPVPPSGPVSGFFECLGQRVSSEHASTIFINEGRQEQVLIQGGLPVRFDDVTALVLREDGKIALVASDGRDALRLVRKASGRTGSWWQIEARGGDGRFWKAGYCFGDLQQGRSERPIRLESIRTVSVEAEGVDE